MVRFFFIFLIIFTIQACSTRPVSFKKAQFKDLEQTRHLNTNIFSQNFLQNCEILSRKDKINTNQIFGTPQKWKVICEKFESQENVFQFIEKNFDLYEVVSDKKNLFTGYYAPFFQGSLTQTKKYSYPLRQKPKDLYTLNLTDFPNLKENGHLVVRVDGNKNKVLPYFERKDIKKSDSKPLVWLKPTDAFFLHIQGSGFIKLTNGETLHVAYQGSNGHKYRAIGRDLVQQGFLDKDKVTMNTIRQFLEKNPDKIESIMNLNPRYIFFTKGNGLVKGSLGVPLYKEKSLAVDPQYIPLGIPVFLETKLTYNGENFKSWMFTEDTGAAIKGGLRGDIYFGQGYEAGQFAGAQNEQGKMYVIVPK
jgi:membrane-bound lytic murein transglycosylase A